MTCGSCGRSNHRRRPPNKSKAARRLGITRTQLYGRLRKYGLDDR